MINKNKIKLFVLAFVLFGFIWFSSAQVSLNPVYSEDRFQPSDAFHAWCENQLDVVFALENTQINGVNAILKYNNADINILKVFPEWEQANNLSYVVENDKITFNKLKTDNGWLDKIVFKLFFKWKQNLKTTDFSFVKWSYVLDTNGNMIDLDDNMDNEYKFNFSTVPECNPDIVSPHVELIFPVLKTGEFVALDSHFQFNIFDQGKWINKDSISISIDDITYDLSNIEHEWDGEMLTIYPDNWLSVWEIVSLELFVWDKQVYGKSNIVNKHYDLPTSDDLYLLNDIDPVQFRKLVNKEKYYHGSVGECELLKENYTIWDELDNKLIMSIAKRLSCPNLSLFVTGEDGTKNITAASNNLDEKLNKLDSLKNTKITVFSVIGWLLFWLTLIVVLFWCFRKK